MLRSRLITILLGLLFCGLCAAADSASPVLRGLFLEGASGSRATWVLCVLQQQELTYARVFQRGEGESQWTLIGGVPGKPVELTRYGSDLVLLMADGSWQIFRHSTGPSLPGGATLLCLAGDESRLYGVGQPPEPETRPATTRSATQPTSQPTTRPVIFRGGAPLVLYELVRGSWKELSRLDTTRTTSAVSLALLSGEPILAVADEQQVELTKFSREQWQPLGRHKINGHLAGLIGEGGNILVYTDNSPGASQLIPRGSDWLAPVTLSADSSIRALGLSGGQIRFIYADKDQAIKERLINPRSFAVESPDAVLQLNEPIDVRHILPWIHWGMMILISLVMLHTYRKREEYQRVSIDWSKVQLAPVGRRFFAGIIDLTPVLAGLLFARVRLDIEITDIMSSQAAMLYYVLPGVVVFLLHTTIVESLAGRSIGKIVTHMHVIRLDGQRPSAGALAIRNLLRVVDLVLFFTLVLMLYLPLRQRIGDLAAGTVVVVDRQEDMAGPDA